MANYSVLVSSTAERALKKVPKKDAVRIVTQIQTLAINPFPQGCRKLSGETDTYRVRTREYRIIYEVEGRNLIILVLKMGHRKDVYR